MSVDVKICGLDRSETVDAAVNAGARMLGFVFYPPSPRNLTSKKASRLTKRVPAGASRVGLFVNPTNKNIENILHENDLELIQLHGEVRYLLLVLMPMLVRQQWYLILLIIK